MQDATHASREGGKVVPACLQEAGVVEHPHHFLDDVDFIRGNAEPDLRQTGAMEKQQLHS